MLTCHDYFSRPVEIAVDIFRCKSSWKWIFSHDYKKYLFFYLYSYNTPHKLLYRAQVCVIKYTSRLYFPRAPYPNRNLTVTWIKILPKGRRKRNTNQVEFAWTCRLMGLASSRHEEGGASDRRDAARGWLLFLDGPEWTIEFIRPWAPS